MTLIFVISIPKLPRKMISHKITMTKVFLLTSVIRPKIRTTFGVHDPLGIRYIFQLRMNLSPLRNHKKT